MTEARRKGRWHRVWGVGCCRMGGEIKRTGDDFPLPAATTATAAAVLLLFFR